jgi:hypothetical protein
MSMRVNRIPLVIVQLPGVCALVCDALHTHTTNIAHGLGVPTFRGATAIGSFLS